MKYLHLVWASLFRRKARTLFTLLSITAAFLLFGVLDTVGGTFAGAGQTNAASQRIVITPKRGVFSTLLPYSLLSQIEELPGVDGVDYASYVVGTYQDPKNSIVVEAHPHSFYDIYVPEFNIAPEHLRAVRSNRMGVLAGEALAKKYGLKVGDKIPLQTKQPRKDGSTVWTFDVVGILSFVNPAMKVYEEMLFGDWNYVEESRQNDTGTVAYYLAHAANVADVDRVAAQIDALTANSAHETKSQNENAWASAHFQQIGDMGLIVTSIMGAVFFTLLLLNWHTMSHAVHERIAEIAVLKTIGFTGRGILGLVLCESISLLLLGAVAGLALAMGAIVTVQSAQLMPVSILPVGVGTWARGLAFAAAIGLAVGLFPALRGMRLRIVDALSGR